MSEGIVEHAIYRLKNPVISYQCLICEKVKDETADIVNTSVAWLCPVCKCKLQKIVEAKE